MTSTTWLARIFWIDGLAGFLAGTFVLSLRTFLADLYGLPLDLVTFMGFANLCYAPYGLTLAIRSRRPLGAIVGLAAANALWALVCGGLLWRFALDAKPLGIAHLLLEGGGVAALARVEWRNRRTLAGLRE